ncbi:hypothetical protein DVH24_014095 [Malus domestica]|uniref:Secreted protein n=1 Tax=Malus domestica TaxID=3750 RepID=A0A498JCI2_MALDO|nr:hypothetical protein DVH24_014095 [Malus domestica]
MWGCASEFMLCNACWSQLSSVVTLPCSARNYLHSRYGVAHGIFKCFKNNTITILGKEGDSRDKGTTLKLCAPLIGPLRRLFFLQKTT